MFKNNYLFLDYYAQANVRAKRSEETSNVSSAFEYELCNDEIKTRQKKTNNNEIEKNKTNKKPLWWNPSSIKSLGKLNIVEYNFGYFIYLNFLYYKLAQSDEDNDNEFKHINNSSMPN